MQTYLLDIYNGISESIEENKPELILLIEEQLNCYCLIPKTFRGDFHHCYGRSRVYKLESMIKTLTLQKLLGITTNKLLFTVLKTNYELHDFCGFDTILDGSQFSHFR